MPNWCNNFLKIEGSPRELTKLMKYVELTQSEETEQHSASPFSCQRIIPRPVEKDGEWYSWSIENWGSKWDVCDVDRKSSWLEEGLLIYTFDTAWSPVVQVIEALATKYPKLKLFYQYYESGSDYWGENTYKNGKETSAIDGSLSSAICEKRLELEGDHHWCDECYESVECEGTETPDVCRSCTEENAKEEKELNELEKSLWEGEVVEVS